MWKAFLRSKARSCRGLIEREHPWERLPSWSWCFWGAGTGGCIILPVIDWSVEVDGQAGTCRHLLWGVCDVITPLDLALPRRGHLDQLFHLFAYLKANHNAEMVFDPSVPEEERDDLFHCRDWDRRCHQTCPSTSPSLEAEGSWWELMLIVIMLVTLLPDALALVSVCFSQRGPNRCQRSKLAVRPVLLAVSSLQWNKRLSTYGVFDTSSGCSAFRLRVQGQSVGTCQHKCTWLGVKEVQLHRLPFCPWRMCERWGEDSLSPYDTHDNPADLLTKPLPAGEKRLKFVSRLVCWVGGCASSVVGRVRRTKRVRRP